MSTFRSETGRLMDVTFDENHGYQYTIWFDYTKKLMRELKVGDLISAPNFSHSDDSKHLSILSVMSIMPFHYATSNDQLSGYPTFLENTRDEAYKDFVNQDVESTEETTKIKITASSTGLELVIPDIEITEESQMPIFGGEVKILDESLVEKIFNSDIENDYITVGNLRKDSTNIKLKIDDMIRTHIGIFGYTGTGKSNLTSTLVHKILQANIPINVVVFDLMGEYTSLLVDVLDKVDGHICFLGKDSLPEQVQQYMTNKQGLEKARDAFIQNMHVPVNLRTPEMKQKYHNIINNLLVNGKIKIQVNQYTTIGEFLEDNKSESRSTKESKQIMKKIFTEFRTQSFEKSNIENLEEMLKSELEDAQNEASKSLLKTWINAVQNHSDFFKPLEDFKIDRNDLVDSLSSNKSSLYIIQSEDEDAIREFAYDITADPKHSIYVERRRKGLSSPLTLFIFDEADEFIPQEPSGTYNTSTKAVETLARRGRKFGIGVVIATQRVTYLNTNIMAQPHTYFISKLPRISDRQRVTDAFGISQEVMRETFKFSKGDWLVISHDATGIKSVPIPIHSDNAEERIKDSKKLI